MAKSRKAQQRNDKSPRPLSAAELSVREAVLATAQVPRKLAKEFSRRLLDIECQAGDREPTLRREKSRAARWQLEVPTTALLGGSVERVHELSDKDLRSSGNSRIADAHRAAWHDIRYQPSRAALQQAIPIPLPNGTIIDPEVVFPPDERTLINPSPYPWHCIGRIVVTPLLPGLAGGGIGSGVLVGPNVVLTADHVVPTPFFPGQHQITFTPAFMFWWSAIQPKWPVSAFTAQVTEVARPSPSFTFSGPDIALLRIVPSFGQMCGWFGAFDATPHRPPPEPNAPWWEQPDVGWFSEGFYSFLVGYPNQPGASLAPMLSSGDVRSFAIILGATWFYYEHDSAPGTSGGPLFTFLEDGMPYVFAAHAGGTRNVQAPFIPQPQPQGVPANAGCGGDVLVRMVLWARDNWR